VVARTEADSLSGGDPKDIYYRYGGKEMGRVSNNGDSNMNFSASAEDRTRTPITGAGAGAFKHGWTSGATSVDFDQNYQAINSYNGGSGAGSYTVRAGDTLQGIAANLYGDSALWYKIASANGLSGASNLTEGTTLRLPAGVQQNTYTAKTFKPYNPAEAIGDISPTTPEPPKDAKCGVFGQILLVVIAVAVTVITAGALGAATATGLNAVLVGAASGAAGSVASQAVGVATGIQDKFSFKNVALAAIGGGVGASGFGKGAIKALGASKAGAFTQGAIRGAANNIAAQGIGVATGLQSKFSWSGVAAAGIGAGVGGYVSDKFGDNIFGALNKNLGYNASGYLTDGVIGGASAIANAATRSALDGSNFGDNIVAAIPDVVGSAIGNAIAGGFGPSPTEFSQGVVDDIAGDLNLTGAAREQFIERTAGLREQLTKGTRDLRRFGHYDPNGAKHAEYLLDDFLDGVAAVDSTFAGLLSQARELTAPIPVETLESAQPQGNGVDEVIVTGQKKSVPRADHAVHKFADRPLVKLGDLTIRLGNSANEVLEKKPVVRVAIRTIDWGLKIYGGPVRLALNKAVGKANEAAIVKTTARFESVGYGEGDAKAGGIGGPVAVGLVLGGVTGALTLIKKFGNNRTITPKINFNWSDINKKVAQSQNRHIHGTKQWENKQGSYFKKNEDAQSVLSAAHNGDATLLGFNSQKQPIVRFDGVTGFNNNKGTGYLNQPTNIFAIKGSVKVSVVPLNPKWRP